MKKLSEKGRKLLRKIYLTLGAAVVSMLFVACYGMPMDCWEDCDYPCCTWRKEASDGNPDTKSE